MARRFWIPAFAGMAIEKRRITIKVPTPNPISSPPNLHHLLVP